MLFFAVKFIFVYWWLFVIFLKFGWARDVRNISQTKGFYAPIHELSFPESTRRPRATSSVAKSSCVTPSQPAHGRYKLEEYFCDDIADCEVAEGISLEPGSQLVYRCNPGYKATANTDVYCSARGKWSTIPECIEVKCDSLNSVSTMVSCTRFGRWISCDSPVPPETRAEVSCRHGYKKDTEFVTARRTTVSCDVDGKWVPRPIRCVPVCGVAITRQQPFVFGGTPAKIGDFPWHASLFIQINSPNGKIKLFICGGTIIQTNLVMTAAHCVYDEVTHTTQNPAKLFVITGNVERDYDAPMHNSDIVRKAKVKNVYTHCNYYGLIGNYASDIALLELEQPFKFSSILLPACLDDSGSSEQILEPGVFGRIAGFGRTSTATTSDILQTLSVPYISYNQCRASKNGDQHQAFISNDKFCAGYDNGSAVCEGDSGGGLVFLKGDLWYVMGIVSVGLGVDIDNGEKTCDKYSYSLYTKVSTYMKWIQDVLFYVERNQPYPSCSRDSSGPMVTTAKSSTGSSCSAPPQPANGEWKFPRDFCPGDTDCSSLTSEGTALAPGSIIIYKCLPQFSAKGSTTVSCQRDGKWTRIPDCAGNSCTLTNDIPGSCALLNNCPSVFREYHSGKSPDTLCGFSAKGLIVCCPTPPPSPIENTKQKCKETSKHTNDSCPPFTPQSVPPNSGKLNAKSKQLLNTVANRFNLNKIRLTGYVVGV